MMPGSVPSRGSTLASQALPRLGIRLGLEGRELGIDSHASLPDLLGGGDQAPCAEPRLSLLVHALDCAADVGGCRQGERPGLGPRASQQVLRHLQPHSFHTMTGNAETQDGFLHHAYRNERAYASHSSVGNVTGESSVGCTVRTTTAEKADER